jgi:hypothetical protein
MRGRMPKSKYQLLVIARQVVDGEMDHLDPGSVMQIREALVAVRFHPVGRRALDRLARLQYGLTPCQ